MVERVIATEAAQALIAQLQAEYGEIMFHQSGGCCDNSAANCYLPTDLTIGPQDVLLGHVGTNLDVPFYISKSQYDTWKHTQLILDVIDGTGGTKPSTPARACLPMKNGPKLNPSPIMI